MIPIRQLAIVLLAAASATLIVVACGSDDPRFSTEVPDSAPAPVPEASSPVDAGVQDADADAPAKPAADASDEPVTCTSTPCVTELAAGDHHFCARISDGTVRCWGDNTQGELGGGPHDGGPTGFGPQAVVALTNVTQVAAAASATCAIGGDAGVYCWGDNSQAQLGLKPPKDVTGVNDSDPHPTPARVPLTGSFVRVDLGPENVYAIANDGKAYGWGNNDSMQLTIADYNYYAPLLLDVGTYAITRTAASFGAALGLTKDAELVGWGAVTGRASTVQTTMAPFPLLTLSGVTSVAIDDANSPHACAVSAGSLYCWGANAKGVLGLGVPDTETLPTLAPFPTNTNASPQQVAVSPNSTCVRMTDGSIQCCGDNTLGQLGQGTTGPLSESFVPASAMLAEHVVQVAVSLDTTCALVQGGDVMCWGGNSKGELGQGNNDLGPHPTPAKVVLK